MTRRCVISLARNPAPQATDKAALYLKTAERLQELPNFIGCQDHGELARFVHQADFTQHLGLIERDLEQKAQPDDRAIDRAGR